MTTTEQFVPQHLSPVHFEHRVAVRPPEYDRVPGGIGEVAARAAFKAATQDPEQQKPFNE